MKLYKHVESRFKRSDFFKYSNIGNDYQFITTNEDKFQLKQLKNSVTTDTHLVFSHFSKLLLPFIQFNDSKLNEIADEVYGKDRVTLDSLTILTTPAMTTVAGTEMLLFQMEDHLRKQEPQLTIASTNLLPNHKGSTRKLLEYELDNTDFVEMSLNNDYIEKEIPNFPSNVTYNVMMPSTITENDEYKFLYRVFYNKETNQAIIITNKHDPYSMFANVAIYLGILPDLTDDQKELIGNILKNYMHETVAAVLDDEMSFMSLDEHVKEKLEVLQDKLSAELYHRMVKDLSVETQIKNLLPVFKNIDKGDERNAKRRVDKIEEEIEELLYRIRELKERKKEAEKDYIYARVKSSDFQEELEYFFANEEIINFNLNDSRQIEFFVYTDLIHFEQEYAEIFIKHPSEFAYYDEEDIYHQATLEIMKDIFVEGNAVIKIGQAFRYTDGLSRVHFMPQTPMSLQKAEDLINAEGKGFMPNLHLSEYSCPGENKSLIETALMESDFIRATEIAIGTLRDFNFTDNVVSADLFRRILVDLKDLRKEPYYKYIYSYETGEYYTPQQYYLNVLGGSFT